MPRYHTPSQGTTNWDEPLNENFENLDRDVEFRDTESNLGNYEPADGAKFLAVDSGKVFIGDGENWNELDHGNEAHSAEYVSDGDGTTRQIWVVENGADDPPEADPDDLIFEEEA